MNIFKRLKNLWQLSALEASNSKREGSGIAYYHPRDEEKPIGKAQIIRMTDDVKRVIQSE